MVANKWFKKANKANGRKKKSLTSKTVQSYRKHKPASLMVNPRINIRGSRDLVPSKFRTKLHLIYGAKEAIAATANNYFLIWLNGLVAPLNTGANTPPGVRIDGSASTVTTTYPTGFLDIMSSGVSPGLYSKYVVLNCRYKITYFPLGLTDAQYVASIVVREATAYTDINNIEELPYSRGPKFMVGYSSTAQNTITGTCNMARVLGCDSDEQYAANPASQGGKTSNPTGLPVYLQVFRASANSTALTSPLPYKIELEFDVEFIRQGLNPTV